MEKTENISEISTGIDKESIFKLALKQNAGFWERRQEELKLLIDQLISEIEKLEKVSIESHLPQSQEEARKIKAIWCLSGTGSLKKPIIGTSGDIYYKDREWGQWTDRKRLLRSIEIIKKLSQISSGQSSETEQEDNQEILIQQNGPFLIYNGLPSQVDDLYAAIKSGEVNFPAEKLFIPSGTINNTLDQVKTLDLPNSLKMTESSEIGIVTHAPHLVRVMRMIKKYEPIQPDISFHVYPLVFEDRKNEEEFAFMEIAGALGYISQGLATFESCPYYL